MVGRPAGLKAGCGDGVGWFEDYLVRVKKKRWLEASLGTFGGWRGDGRRAGGGAWAKDAAAPAGHGIKGEGGCPGAAQGEIPGAAERESGRAKPGTMEMYSKAETLELRKKHIG